METKHFSHKHPLMAIEELETYLKREEICSGCEKPVLGPACICSECDFLLHKLCFEQLRQEIQSPLHLSSHPLVLLPTHAAGTIFCDACGKLCDRCLVYHCSHCNFNLDFQCASQRQISANDCPEHAFVPISQQMQFTCEACGKKCEDKAHVCGNCLLLVEHACTRWPSSIKVISHDHNLSLIYFFNQIVKKHDNDTVDCCVCYLNVNMEHAAYYCQDCSYIAHLQCAGYFEGKTAGTSLLDSVEEIFLPGEREIMRFFHKHKLLLEKEELRYDLLCDGCMLLITSAPFYSCADCEFFLHDICARLHRIKRHRLHHHLLTLVSHVPSKYSLFECNACNRYRHGFIYRCDPCNYNLDLQCFTTPDTLKHEGHQHSLHLPLYSYEKCSGCGFLASNRSFVCKADAIGCKFNLCFLCANLPLVIRHPYDTHGLNLTYTTEDKYGEYYCLICEEERNPEHWFYYCKECDFSCHPSCIVEKYRYTKFGKKYKDEDHPHSLTVVHKTKDSSPCDSCGKPFDGVALECTQCKFIVHPEGYFLERTSTPWIFRHV